MKIPRIVIAAPSSGSGKTVFTCALMRLLKEKGKRVAACKCGPDYIDPMFHREVLGMESENVDLFFCEKQMAKKLFTRHTKDADIAVVEGVMGFYDGMSLNSDQASTYEVAKTLEAPVILVLSCRGMALTVVPMIQGMMSFRENSQIKGVVLNHVSSMLYPKLKEMIEHEIPEIKVLGYMPDDSAFGLESRHLGLITPDEISSLQEQLLKAAEILNNTIDVEMLLELAHLQKVSTQGNVNESITQMHLNSDSKIRIGVARDAAFNFYYKDNLEFLKEHGCELVHFSPLHDSRLPDDLQGLIIGGGYPESYAKELSENTSMKESIKEAIANHLPTFAECGGFMYLQKSMEGMDGNTYPMCGVLEGDGFRTGRLGRFGYINITAETDGAFLKKGETIRGHEFHYWDCTDNGEDCTAVKPNGLRSWKCIHMQDHLFAGYPHLHFYSNENFALRFIDACIRKKA